MIIIITAAAAAAAAAVVIFFACQLGISCHEYIRRNSFPLSLCRRFHDADSRFGFSSAIVHINRLSRRNSINSRSTNNTTNKRMIEILARSRFIQSMNKLRAGVT